MTVNELIEALSDFSDEGHEVGDMEICVEAFGGMRMGKPISGVSMGFDWDAGKVILHPAQALRLYCKSEGKSS